MKDLKVIVVIIGIMSFALSQASWAGEQEVIKLGEVVVTATRTERPIESVPASVTVITSEDIEKSPAHSADELLRELAGVTVRHYQGILSSSTTNSVTMRGLVGTEGRVLILRDGVPINDSYGGAVEWNEVDVDDIERIEVVRGAGSALYGSNAMGGVINIITKKPEKEIKTSVETGYGSMNTWLVSLKNSATLGKFGYYISGGYLESDGYCDVAKEKRKSYHTDKEVERHNIGGKLTYEVDPSSSCALSSSHYRQEDTGRYKIPGYEVTSEQNRVGLNYQKKGDGWNLRTNLYKNNDESFYTSPYYDRATKTYNAIKYNSYNEQETFGGTLQTSINLTKNNILTIGSDYKRGEIDRCDEYLTETRDIKVKGKQEYIALFVQDELNLGDKLSVILGGRYDWWESFAGYGYDDNTSPKEADYPEKSDESFNPKIGVNYYLTDSTTLWGSAGTAFRAPTLSDLYRTYVGAYSTYRGNPDLDPEELVSYEAGINQDLGEKVSLKATYYETHAKDFIYSIYKCKEGIQKIYEKKNVGKIRIKGVELEANCNFNKDWSFFANYTFNESKITEHEDKPELEGKYLAKSPKEKYAFGITYSNPEIITARFTGRYVGMRYNDDNNKVELESYFTTDLKLSRQIGKYLEAALSVTNINDVHFAEASGYESPGRMIMGTVKVTF